MINLNENPSAILELKQNDLVIVDDQVFITDITPIVEDGIYLSVNNESRKAYFALSRKKMEGMPYDCYVQHLRNSEKKAVMSRQQLLHVIRNKQYTVS